MDHRKAKIFSAIVMLVFTMLACNFIAPTREPEPPVTTIVGPTSASQPDKIPLTEADVPRVSLEEAKAAVDSGAAVIVDVRSPQAYEAGHVAGAVSVPLGDIETNPDSLNLDKDQWIITYCT